MAADNPIRVMVVDDHTIVRGGLRFFLLAFEDIELVAEACSGEEALDLCERPNPDVILMDMVMPGMSAAEATRAICFTPSPCLLARLDVRLVHRLDQRTIHTRAFCDKL